MPPFRCILPVPTLALVMLAADAARADIPDNVTFRNFFGEGVTFERPVQILEVPMQDSVFLVVQQSGAIYRLQHDGTSWNRSVFDSLLVTGINGADGALISTLARADA
jgi:hypothetical protein